MSVLPGLSQEERLEIIYEVHLVLRQNRRVQLADSPKSDFFNLFSAIMEDRKFLCDVTQLIVQVMKKSPVWPKVLPFLERSTNTCRVSGCSHSIGYHTNGGKCGAKKYNKTYTAHTMCTCMEFVKKTF